MSEQTREEALEERIYKKLLAKIRDENQHKMKGTSATSNKSTAITMGGQIITHEEELAERIYKKVLVKIQDNMNVGNVKSQSNKQQDENGDRETTDESTNTWICIASGERATNAPSGDDDPSIFQLPQDMYAILATASWRSLPFWVSILVIVGFQYVLILLMLANKTDISSDGNVLNIPANVETPVRIGQVIILFIALFAQGDLLAGIESFVKDVPDHFCGNSRFTSMTRLQWKLSAIVQLLQGLINFVVSFILILQSQTVPKVILTVLGVSFISDLDELAFGLCTDGYLGGSMKRMSRDVCDVRFHRQPVISRMSTTMTVRRKVRKDAHIVTAFAVFVMALVGFSYVAIRQENGVYSVQDIRIEFGDEVLPSLGLFNGCYQKSESTEHVGGRLVYEQVGYPNGGKFGFCSAFGKGPGGWTFYIGNKGEDELCKNYILRSGSTSTFDLLEAGKTKWYTYNDLPIDFLEITENKAPTKECGQSIFQSAKDACPSILAFGTMPMTKLSPSANVAARLEKSLDAAFSHPIYYSNNNDNDSGSFTLIFFTGRRWIRTNSDYIHGLGKETSVSQMEDFFFERNGFFKFIDQLIRTPAVDDEETEMVSAISEIVDTKRDQGSPLGLLWYLPRYAENKAKTSVAEMTETEKLQRNFPSAILARSIDQDWGCLVCNDELNPCLNDGICDTDKGTCVCKHGETGELCQILPLANGICNLHYNTAEHNYDGGDCCAMTCMGEDCGKDDLPDPFSDMADSYLDEEGGFYYPFVNKTEEWKKTFRGRKFAYGVDIVGDDNNSLIRAKEMGDPPLRFNHCINPNTALLTFEQKGRLSEDLNFINVAPTVVRCDGSLYLQTPSFDIGITNSNNQTDYIFKEEVRVPYDSRCEFRIWDWTEISIFAENSPVPFLQQQGDPFGDPISLRIPESECVWDAFDTYNIPPVFTDDEYQEFSGGVDLGSMCNRDPGELLERYAVWKVVQSVSNNNNDGGGTSSQSFDGHICDKLEWSSFRLFCGEGGLRVNAFGEFSGDTLPSEIWSLTQLQYLNANVKNLTSLPSELGRLVSLGFLELSTDNLASLPSELGNLASLTYLSLKHGNLASIPSELGRLTSLEELYLGDNNLTSLPMEIGKLPSLTRLHLDGNRLTWIPSEIGRLTLLELLDLTDNQLTSLPTEIGGLGLLWVIDLSDNNLTLLPSEMGRLTSLAFLEASRNQLTRIPSELGRLVSSLQHLTLDENKLTQIPPEIGNLVTLYTLNVTFNPMTWDSLPIEVQNLESNETQIAVCRDDGGDGCL